MFGIIARGSSSPLHSICRLAEAPMIRARNVASPATAVVLCMAYPYLLVRVWYFWAMPACIEMAQGVVDIALDCWRREVLDIDPSGVPPRLVTL